MAKTAFFGPELFGFLENLKENNNRDWFLANKQRYESAVRVPMLRFIADFSPRLKKISPRYVADPRPVGGSLMRPYRDTRFSSDKSPYKTMAGAFFRHERGKTEPAPGFFLHLEPGSSFAGIGIHSPDSPTLSAIRRRIAANPEEWKAAISGRAFRARCNLLAESLQRPPRGFPPDHPCIDDLKRKHYCTMTPFSERDVCAGDFLEQFTETCAAASKFMEYLTRALGLAW